MNNLSDYYKLRSPDYAISESYAYPERLYKSLSAFCKKRYPALSKPEKSL